jgi:tol-pal system protein YbgF
MGRSEKKREIPSSAWRVPENLTWFCLGWWTSALPVAGLGLGFGLIAGCATSAPSVSAAAEQERLVLQLRAKNAGYVRQIEELENRVFILEDQLDSWKLATEQKAPATLPARSRPSDAQDEGPDTVETTIVAEHAVEYAGEAVQVAISPGTHEAAGGPRPWLRLSSSSSSRERSARLVTAAAAPEPGFDPGHGLAGRAASDPLRLYREALGTLRAGRPDMALPQFRRFLDANPVHDYADNAQYWIGECHYAERRFSAAARAFRDVVERYPRGNKVPDAMLKLGFTLQAMGDEAGGRAVLESLARAFPKHDAARLASERLAHPEGSPSGSGGPPTFGTVLPLAAPSAAAAPTEPPRVGRVHR